MAVAFDGYGLSIASEVFPPSLTQIEGGDLLNLTFHLNYNGTKIGALHENSSACHELKNSSLFVNLVIALPIVFDIVSHSNQSSQSGIVTSNISNCSFVPLLKINSSSSVVSNHMPGIKALNFHIFSQNFSWTATLNVRLKLLPSARADSLLNITANVTISNKTMEDDISIASYRTAVPGNLQFELKSTSIPETPGPTLTSEEEITLFASFHIPRITANIKLQVLLPVFRNSTPMKFVSGSVVDLSEGVKPKLLIEGSGPRFIVSPSTAHLFPLTQNVVEFAFGDTVNKGNESFNGTITVEVTGAVDSSRGVYIPESFGNVTCILMYDSPRGSYLTANKTLITLKLGQPLLEFHLEADNSDCCYEGKDMVDIKYEVKNPDFSTAPAWNLTLNISVLSADIELHNFSAFLCGNTSIFNMTSNQSVAETKCRDLYGTHMLTKANAGLQVKLTRLNASSWVYGHLYNYVNSSVAAGSFHDNNLTLEYTRKGWLPIGDVDTETIGIKNVAALTPSVLSSDVPDLTGDPKDVTIGEDIVLQAIVQIPVSTNPGFFLKLFGSGFEAVDGQITTVGRNIKSLEQRIDAAYNLNVSGSTVSSNLGTVVNVGDNAPLSASTITYTATMRVADVVQNINGKRLAIVSDTIVNGQPQVPSSLTLKVVLPDLSVTVTVNKISGVDPNDELTFTVKLSHSKHSASHAYRVLLEIAASDEYFENVQEVGSPDLGDLSVVAGNNAPSGNPRYNNSNTKVILYQVTDGLLLGKSVSFQYKATTVGNLQPSIYISSPVFLSYATLPPSLSPREGRKFEHNSDQASFLTFRPLPYVTVSFQAPANDSFDAGDRVEYELILNNIDSTISAYSLSVIVSFETVDTNSLNTSCSGGTPKFNATTKQSRLFITPLAPSQSIHCKYESRLQARVSPKQLISQMVTVEYYNKDVGNNPQNAASYNEKRHANITTKCIDTSILSSKNADKLEAGDPVNFTVQLQLPECETNLSVVVDLPTVPESVIDLARKRRSLQGIGIESEEDNLRSRHKRSAGVVNALSPILGDSFVKYGNGLTLSLIPVITPANPTTLTIPFGNVQNLPGSGSNDTIEIFLKFNTANRPLILSGRRLYLTVKLNFDAGSDSGVKQFVIVGPLVKPLLSIVKTVEIAEKNVDSPLVLFNITVSHTNASVYDATNLTVQDSTQGMDFYDSDSSTQGAFVTFPRKNSFEIRFTLRSLRVGETRSFIYVARFKVDEKEPTTLRIPATVTWKSVQLNSLTYRVSSDASTSCLQRADVDEPERRKVFGYFALGVFLGLLFGALIAAILILVVIKCCDKGKMAPYYTRFTNTTTMTVLTGGSQYIYHGGEMPDNKPVETHKEISIVQTDESIVPILALDKASQTEKEFNSLDVQATAALDADLEAQRQNMFIRALKLLAKKLRVKRDISTEQENKFALEIKQAIGAVAFKMAAEYRRKSAELRRRLTADGKNRLDALHREQAKEREETENKIKGLVNEREKKNILELLKRRQDAQEEELKQNLKLEQDVEMEKLRKEISISKRFALKESQNQLIQNLIKDAKLNEEQANAIMKNHLANMAAIDKATDEERARRVMALEMRLAERRALAKQKHEEEERKKGDRGKLEQNHAEALENLVRSSNLNSEDAATYLERFRKDLEVVDSKLAKDRKRQEQKLHHKLTALKQKRIEEKLREHQREIKEFEEQQDEKFEQVEIDTVSSITEKQKILQKNRQEIEEIEQTSDREAAEQIEALRDQQTHDGNQMIKNNTQKMYQELVNKGLSESEKEAILERHMADIAMQQEAREEERKRQRGMLEKRLEKQRAALEKKMKEEQVEQAEIRKQEDKIVGDLIINQVAMSEEEREKIIQEHEKNLAALESSLTLNKLRQRQMLEDKLAQRRKRRMEELEQKQMHETKDRDYSDKILVEGEDIEMIKKHEQEKMAAMKEDELQIDDEMEAVRQEMLAERSKRLEEHHEKLGAIIANLQIEKAKQISKIAMQQQALGQLQAGLIDELESKGTFQDPETQKIMEKYQKDTKNLEDNLKEQKERQEKALKERLQERMRQREETLVQKQKDELTQYLNGLNVNNMAMKLRKAALKARHEKERNEMKNRLQKEIDQSINELKMTFDIKRMQAIEEQNIKLISILVQQGKLQEGELESVLKYLFPKKSSNEIDELLSKIYGSNHTKESKQTFTDPRRPSTLEARIRRRSSVHMTTPPAGRKQSKTRKMSKKDQEELPPINFKGSKKGFNLNDSNRGYRTLSDNEENEFQRKTVNQQPAPQKRGSYQQLTEENNQELVDAMFGDSPEKVRKKSGKKQRRRRPRDDDDEPVV